MWVPQKSRLRNDGQCYSYNKNSHERQAFKYAASNEDRHAAGNNEPIKIRVWWGNM